MISNPQINRLGVITHRFVRTSAIEAFDGDWVSSLHQLQVQGLGVLTVDQIPLRTVVDHGLRLNEGAAQLELDRDDEVLGEERVERSGGNGEDWGERGRPRCSRRYCDSSISPR